MNKISKLQNNLILLKQYNCIKRNINPNIIGYQLPNGNINFVSKEGAYNYAKNKVLKALHTDPPFEKGIVIKENTIISEIKGNTTSVCLAALNLKDTTIVHGHPNVNAPLSFEDAITFIKCNAKKIIAFNSYGKYSQLTVLPKQKWQKILPEKMLNYISKLKIAFLKYNEHNIEKKLSKRLDINLATINNEAKNIFKNSDAETKKILIKWQKNHKTKNFGNTSEIPAEIRPFFEKINEFDKLRVQNTQLFWKRNAGKLGMKYETNL